MIVTHREMVRDAAVLAGYNNRFTPRYCSIAEFVVRTESQKHKGDKLLWNFERLLQVEAWSKGCQLENDQEWEDSKSKGRLP